jgi:hypothetical protein
MGIGEIKTDFNGVEHLRKYIEPAQKKTKIKIAAVGFA